MNGSIQCRGCSREHRFRAVHSVQLVCRYCQQLVQRNNPTSTGSPVLPPCEDMSVLRIGAVGKGEKGTFEVIGRVQHLYQEGYRNLWYLLYQNGDCGWLGDWEGGYSLLVYHQLEHDFGLLSSKPGKQLKAFGTQFEVRRITKHRITYREGELPKLSLHRESFMALELGNEQEQVILAHAYTQKDLEAFAGTFEYFKDLSFNQLRPHHEWV